MPQLPQTFDDFFGGRLGPLDLVGIRVVVEVEEASGAIHTESFTFNAFAGQDAEDTTERALDLMAPLILEREIGTEPGTIVGWEISAFVEGGFHDATLDLTE